MIRSKLAVTLPTPILTGGSTIKTWQSALLVPLLAGCVQTQPPRLSADEQVWYQAGRAKVNELVQADALTTHPVPHAKNIVLFIGDGMGISTVTAARIFAGQQGGQSGEEHQLYFETFPHLALVKTYNTNQQVPDSAGTMTAIMSGVKTKAGVIGAGPSVVVGDCATLAGRELPTLLELAGDAGMATGVVTTARLTHATPAATYAHTVDRDYEFSVPGPGCDDIARQLLATAARRSTRGGGAGLRVALGGGRSNFLPQTLSAGRCGPSPHAGQVCHRLDGADLVRDWLGLDQRNRYVADRGQLLATDAQHTGQLLGLFADDHMAYEMDRGQDQREPSLREMTAKAIELLRGDEDGFFLMVEAGRIDHAHHLTNPRRALADTVALADAVRTAAGMTSTDDTLMLVTADHSHVFTIGGYPTRGNPILGLVVGNNAQGNPEASPALAADGLPYTTLGYANGPGVWSAPGASAEQLAAQGISQPRRAGHPGPDPTSPGYRSESLVPLGGETHGGEDVAVYASGPGSQWVRGVLEQNVLFHLMDRAGNISNRAGRHRK